MNGKRIVLLLIFLLAALVSQEFLFAQNVPQTVPVALGHRVVPASLSLEVRPSFDVPLGNSTQYFNDGEGVDLSLDYRFPRSDFYVFGGVEYAYASTQIPQTVSVAAARVGAGIALPLGSRLGLIGFASGGYYFGTLNDFSVHASDPYAAGGLGLNYSFSPAFGLGIVAQYTDYLGLYQGLSLGVGTTIGLSRAVVVPSSSVPKERRPLPLQPQPLSTPLPALLAGGAAAVEIAQLNLEPIFPVFYKYYDDHPIGGLVVKNESTLQATNLKVRVFAKQYMDYPKEIDLSGTLASGASRTIDLYALFTDSVLGITEGTKAFADISVEYDAGGHSYEKRKIATLTFVGRNGMRWDDTRKAAAFVTAEDPAVLAIARSVAGYVETKENRPINEALEVAIALHDALSLYGLNYVSNPVTPYAVVSKEKNVVDFLQFPRETLRYKAGDCSDISILYSALLEAVGIHTAFVTIPGHIFVAVNTGLTSKQAESGLIPLGALINHEGTEWIPVEVTSIHEGFLKAWDLGAKEWYENKLLGQAGFYPIQDAWKEYKPVGLPGTDSNIVIPPMNDVFASYSTDVQGYVDETIRPRVAALEADIRRNGSISAMNNLGILYAKWGRAKEAEQQFRQVLAKKNYLPAVLNLGNLYYLEGDWTDALAYYRRASDINPGDPLVLLAMAKTNEELENFGNAKQSYAKLRQIDPALADQYSYLGLGPAGATIRSADVEKERREVVWASEH